MIPRTTLFLLPLLPFASAHIYPPQKILFTYQCRSTGANEWLEILTLCFAPLVAHIAGGVPAATLFGRRSQAPSWLARLPHFNPISIVWRYMAIADRRVRALNWDKCDLAAANAVFWDGENGRWDGSERMMVRSRAWITKKPELVHTPVWSAASVVTLVTTYQGVWATFLIVASVVPGSTFRIAEGLPYAFLPLGCLGLIRLMAAFWLTSEHGFSNPSEKGENTGGDEHVDAEIPEEAIRNRLSSAKSGKGVAFRVLWFLLALGLLGVSAASSSRLWWSYRPAQSYISVSRLLYCVLYFITTSGGLFITCAYVVVGKTDTTIIPCIHSVWYKVYTILLMALALAVFLSSALETRIQANGKYTTLPPFNCTSTSCVPVTPGHGNSNL